MYIYHFYNRLYSNEIRTIVTSFPCTANMLDVFAVTWETKGWMYSLSPPNWWRNHDDIAYAKAEAMSQEFLG